MNANDRARSADALRDVLDLIDGGELEASTGERAYVAGSLHGLTGEPSTEADPVS